MADAKKTTSMGLEQNVAGLLSYLAWFITGLIFYFGEKENRFVRFHALQSIALSVVFFVAWIAVMIVNLILGAIGAWFLVTLLSLVLWLGGLAIWIFCMIKAFQGATFKLPFIGDFVEKQLK
jgi:uncharacterized membrane protein